MMAKPPKLSQGTIRAVVQRAIYGVHLGRFEAPPSTKNNLHILGNPADPGFRPYLAPS
jgi:hypothetical protein